jgi:hypothetical protein
MITPGMNNRILAFASVLSAMTTASCFAAANPHVGTWKFNPARSHIPNGVGKNLTVVYSEHGGSIKATMDGTEPDGSPKHSIWIGKFDGKPYPVRGTPAYDSVSYRVVDDHSASIEAFKHGKLMWWGTITISRDGKTRTANLRSTDAHGKTVITKKVYDKW